MKINKIILVFFVVVMRFVVDCTFTRKQGGGRTLTCVWKADPSTVIYKSWLISQSRDFYHPDLYTFIVQLWYNVTKPISPMNAMNDNSYLDATYRCTKLMDEGLYISMNGVLSHEPHMINSESHEIRTHGGTQTLDSLLNIYVCAMVLTNPNIVINLRRTSRNEHHLFSMTEVLSWNERQCCSHFITNTKIDEKTSRLTFCLGCEYDARDTRVINIHR